MLKKLKYESLANLGLTIYQPRVGRHPAALNNNETCIIPEHIRVNASCLVLLFAEQTAIGLTAQELKILQGMLSVLELAPNEIMSATIYAKTPVLDLIQTQIMRWQPKFILQLDMELPVIARQNCIRTFSPAYLLHNPQYKSQAYKTLLGLRAMLHGKS